MSNTKWREVLTTIARRQVWFQLQLVGWEADTFSKLIAPHHGFFEAEHTPKGFVDGVLGSGFFFREIWRVRCPLLVPGRLLHSTRDCNQDIAGLLQAFLVFGQVPINQTANHLEIRGYDQSLTSAR